MSISNNNNIPLLNNDEWVSIGSHILGGGQDQLGFTGAAMSGDGKVIAVSAMNKDNPDPNLTNKKDHGAIYVFKYDENDSNKWVQYGDIIYGSNKDHFGFDISLNNDGSVIAISSIQWDDDNSKGSAKIYEYKSSTSTWSIKYK